MTVDEPRIPGLYYWCPITGDGRNDPIKPIDIIQPPRLMCLRPDGLAEDVEAKKRGDVQFAAPFHVDDALWSRFAGCPEHARVYAYRLLNDHSRQHHDSLV